MKRTPEQGRQPGECPLSRKATTLPLEAIDTSTGMPGYKCPQCSKIVKFRRFNPYEREGKHYVDVTITYHKAASTARPRVDPMLPLDPSVIEAIKGLTHLGYTVNGHVRLRCNEVLAMVNEINQWRAWYAALPKQG